MTGVLEQLKGGGVALIATDTVYGLAALPGSEGYREIFKLKNRDPEQVLPWLVSGVEDLHVYGASVPDYASRLANMFWPGALTLIVRASEKSLDYGCVAEDGTIALRSPDDATCLELLRGLGAPLACTSANAHGASAPSCISDVDPKFAALPHVENIASRCEGGQSSTIVDCTGDSPVVIRRGNISEKVLHTVAFLDATLC